MVTRRRSFSAWSHFPRHIRRRYDVRPAATTGSLRAFVHLPAESRWKFAPQALRTSCQTASKAVRNTQENLRSEVEIVWRKSVQAWRSKRSLRGFFLFCPEPSGRCQIHPTKEHLD